ncbi:2,3-diphosphoglycerate-dependent phosphoglycerate mutase [Buchnera aphidicola str. APS (Acyrthosiphon pisum)]|uniref:2,3-bisphosphoglycerate-dependent phosphoglycerate mutase n=1 Tax=Buchnera aphidicola subsp. Acyrthosiphon pisum (strain APS) TaxID=107806 RepID=GPMA_BUCAI|nr:2,3-diphosphoglycerate-dependent phosphoglycerate mutase [Buchnera aphidicola]P57390.1 RecName: Full=2,3-bisphosphoglycerate-dependent phosphoglycerate mutase; Short=BPG-dependent PGAM; Short=PGAM; Short=Phosphoglyceromutase; Short=dPGM [Buchnera aphidicola str. APS (Acyrthosiphon pisum)]pir/E84965/ phosphoglycerate mutase (EC 5.4.2.1) [imported] - Buchnera sp. (strain APS) [Buchnera sp. (in: enterobacteria)]BAB13013.1 phosphoglycerate mutase [Buchnera aphidicola str. APS (Acyrthosiphon pisum
MKINQVVLIRHGQSEWNTLNKFTGWHDAELDKKGKDEAKFAAILLKKEKFFFDCAHTSLLKRAIHTLQYILDELNQTWLSVKKSWRLNERHYGALEGLNKDEVIEKYGQKQVLLWRRSFDISPPQINIKDKRFPGNDPRYSHLNIHDIPLGESLEKTAKRVIPYWNKIVYPELKNNKKILIVAHGNSLRALIQHLYKIDNKAILDLNIPTAQPIILDFDNEKNPIKWHYLT